jgi:hypothetical protein
VPAGQIQYPQARPEFEQPPDQVRFGLAAGIGEQFVVEVEVVLVEECFGVEHRLVHVAPPEEVFRPMARHNRPRWTIVPSVGRSRGWFEEPVPAPDPVSRTRRG